MDELWSILLPLALGSAVVPVQIALTIMMLRASTRSAASWVGGMTTTRLAQGTLFGLVLAGATASDTDAGRSLFESVVLLMVAVLFLTVALRKLLGGRDEEPPKWLKLSSSATSGKAFVAGAAYVAIDVKLWVFTLGAIGALGEAELGLTAAIPLYVLFVVIAQAVPLAVVTFAVLAPASSQTLVEGFSGWLERHDREVVIVAGLVFGTWFLVKALSGLGVI